jgi:VWFA-related protein
MLFLALSVLLQAAPPAQVRSVPVSVVDEKGAPVTSLAAEEIALLENGVVREVTRLQADRRPLTVAIVVDSTQEISSQFRLFLVDAVTEFLKGLPEGTRYSLWITGDRPQKIVDFTDDAAQGARALRRAIATGGNTLLDALVLASREIREIKAKEDQRTAVVVVTGQTTGVGNRDRYRSLEETQDNADVFLSVQFGEGGGSFEDRTNYDYVLGTLAKRSGGLRETPVSVMGVAALLRRAAGELSAQYRLSYATLPDLKERKLELRVARPGVKVRVGAGDAPGS